MISSEQTVARIGRVMNRRESTLTSSSAGTARRVAAARATGDASGGAGLHRRIRRRSSECRHDQLVARLDAARARRSRCRRPARASPSAASPPARRPPRGSATNTKYCPLMRNTDVSGTTIVGVGGPHEARAHELIVPELPASRDRRLHEHGLRGLVDRGRDEVEPLGGDRLRLLVENQHGRPIFSRTASCTGTLM